MTDTASPISVLDLQREQRAVAVLDTLRNLGEFLAGVRGRRKAVLLFSEGLEMPLSYWDRYFRIHDAASGRSCTRARACRRWCRDFRSRTP